MLTTILSATTFLCTLFAQTPDTADAVYLSDHADLITYSQQAWGELGLNVCAHAPDQTPLPLKIADKDYAKGLGHHANGEIVIDLNGQYATFSADVGIQTQASGIGSAVFKVFVDDQLKFDSGIMKGGQPAKAVSVPVDGAGELRLEVSDAGDGITCDCANWADARLTKSATPAAVSPLRRLDAAPFARVVTSDPARMTGCKANRTEEYLQEDVYLETDLTPDAAGNYAVPFTANGPGVIGLRWLERRMLLELALDFADAAPASTAGVQLQYWSGASAWQGEWKPIPVTIQAEPTRWRVKLNSRDNSDLRLGTRRIRWIFPASVKSATVKSLTAVSAASLEEVRLQIECDPKVLGDSAGRMAPAEITIYNGQLTSPTPRGLPGSVRWNYRNGEPLTVTLLRTKPRAWKTDTTQLLFRLPASGGFGVSIDDVLTAGQVYVKAYGIYVTTSPAKTSLDEYRRQIAGRKTILEEVRHMPDQTFAQAIAKVHHGIQDRQPTMLSLACDNYKFVVYRDGTVHFPADPTKPEGTSFWPQIKDLAQLHPAFGTGQPGQSKRYLDGGWYPIPINELQQNGLLYRQRSFVVPLEDQPLPEPGWLSPHPLCVVEFTIENPQAEPAAATLSFTFERPDKGGTPALRSENNRVLLIDGNTYFGTLDLSSAAALKPQLDANKLSLTGTLPAGQSTRVFVFLPGWSAKPEELAALTGNPKLAERCQAYWNHVLAPAAQISVPDPLLTNVIKASQVHCLIAARSEANAQRVAPWISSTLYGPLESEAQSIIRGMDYLGHHEFARRAHDYYLSRYNPAGMLTTGYTLMGTGWHLWTLGQHYQLTHDTAWLKTAAPTVARACTWIMAQREKTKAPAKMPAASPPLDKGGPGGVNDHPEYGLVPPGVMADWNDYAFHFCLNAYYYAALKTAGTALADIDQANAKTWLDNAADYKSDILRAYRWTQSRMPAYALRDGTSVPGYPSQVHSPGPVGNFFPGEDANRSWCYDIELGAHHLIPLGVLDENSPDASWIIDHQEDVQFFANGMGDYSNAMSTADWYNLGGFSKVQPYYTRNVEIYALRDEVKPFIRSYFNTLPSLLNMENLSIEEHFALYGAWNKTHETGYFLHQSRLMLVMEKKQELWLAPFVTCNWMKDGQKITVQNAPTRFGPVSYEITSHVAENRIEATITPPTRNAPEAIVLRLRHPEEKPMRQVTVNGAEHRHFDPGREIIHIPAATPAPIKVVATY